MNNLNYGVIGNCRTAALISEKGISNGCVSPTSIRPLSSRHCSIGTKAVVSDSKCRTNTASRNLMYLIPIYYPPISLPTKENLSCSTSCRATVPMKKSTICPQKYIVISVG